MRPQIHALLLLVVISYSKLIIQTPPQLKQTFDRLYPEGIPYSVANYGDVPFGKSLIGTIFTTSYLSNCEYQQLDPEAQRSINRISFATRGDCTFTTKSLTAQKQGAKLVIIADNLQEDPGRIVMVDDGKGPQVKIPTILVSHEVGQVIVDFLINKKSSISVMVNFETAKTKKADVVLWMNSYDRKSYMLVRDLQPYLTRIGSHMSLSLYHSTSYCNNCLDSDCFGGKDFCINTGYYGYMIQGYGREVIKQQIRQQIILKLYPNLWWKYVETYDEQCDRDTMIECTFQCMKKVGIQPESIQNQVAKSFYNVTTATEKGEKVQVTTSKILQNNQLLRSRSGLIVLPGIIVNNITYRGNLDPLDVFELICQSLEEQPEACDLSVKPTQHSIWKFVAAVAVIFVVVMVFLILLYRRRARREISRKLNSEVNDLVNQYITMYEAERFESYEMTKKSTPQNSS